jgi:hypothetical protein
MQISGEFIVRQFGKIKAISISDRVLLKTLVESYPEYLSYVKERGLI